MNAEILVQVCMTDENETVCAMEFRSLEDAMEMLGVKGGAHYRGSRRSGRPEERIGQNHSVVEMADRNRTRD